MWLCSGVSSWGWSRVVHSGSLGAMTVRRGWGSRGGLTGSKHTLTSLPSPLLPGLGEGEATLLQWEQKARGNVCGKRLRGTFSPPLNPPLPRAGVGAIKRPGADHFSISPHVSIGVVTISAWDPASWSTHKAYTFCFCAPVLLSVHPCQVQGPALLSNRRPKDGVTNANGPMWANQNFIPKLTAVSAPQECNL